MTGMYPFHFGYYRNPSDEGGVMLGYTMLPEVLRTNGYRTHALGKWHLGFKNASYTPTLRGFDTFVGYWHWGEEYGDHVFPPYYKGDDVPCRGFDLNNNTGTDLRVVGGGGYSAPGNYSTELYTGEAARIIAAHPPDAPLYLYLAYQNVHDPYETAPAAYTALYPDEADAARRNFSALVTLLDDGVRNVTLALQAAGLWESALLVFTSDNGAELPLEDPTPELAGGAGSNWPLRGGKFTLWEGGIRTQAVLFSASASIIPAPARGTVFDSMVRRERGFFFSGGGGFSERGRRRALLPLGILRDCFCDAPSCAYRSRATCLRCISRTFFRRSSPRRACPCPKTPGPSPSTACPSGLPRRSNYRARGMSCYTSPSTSSGTRHAGPAIW